MNQIKQTGSEIVITNKELEACNNNYKEKQYCLRVSFVEHAFYTPSVFCTVLILSIE